ncbi:MAG TPA: PAS domain-containing sensor histidine kinase [Magnetospirillaceae bacterium]|jgi:two-component system nitrogen regulation sensor histidine kinase NtrY
MATTSSTEAASPRPFTARLWDATQRLRVGRALTAALALAVVLAGIATYVALAGGNALGGTAPKGVIVLLAIDLVLILLIGALVVLRIVRVWIETRSGAAGSRLHVRLVVMFSVVSVTPAIVVAVLSALLIQFGIEEWFNARVSTAIQESSAVANAYLEEHQQVIRGDALAMANDLNRESLSLAQAPGLLGQILSAQAAVRTLSEAVVFDSTGEVLGRAGLAYSLEASIPQIPKWAYERARNGEVVVITSPGDERVRALALLQPGLDRDLFLYVGRFVDPRVLDHVERTNRANAEYDKLQGSRHSLEITFTIIYVIIALLLLLGAVWVGLTLATRLANPIARLIDAAERVRGGDLSARVEVHDEEPGDEIDSLSQAFNRMTSQLSAQRAELIETNRELDERRRFSEAVLSGVTAGVIGLDREGRIELPNRSAAELLSLDPSAMAGRPLAEVVPEMALLLANVRKRADGFVQDEIRVVHQGRARVFLVRIVGERSEEVEASGYVVTFDDVTDLVMAQRQAAWADVARRIAHEIKNPLTPIQLSAERLKRKYLSQITTDKETFISCTDTIVRQVGDIGRMVDEFSSFARMPAPIMRNEDICDVARQAVFLARNGYPNIAFETALPTQAVTMACDARQLGQALTNVIKNAVEAIEGREGTDLPQGRIIVNLSRSDDGIVTLTVHDNGKGLPAEQRERLTEPYVTTRAKGTGLGLAIVKKIMEDHGGELVLADVAGAGAAVSLIFRPRDVTPTREADAKEPPNKVSSHGA